MAGLLCQIVRFEAHRWRKRVGYGCYIVWYVNLESDGFWHHTDTHSLTSTPTPTLSTMAEKQRTAAETAIRPSSEFASHEMRITQGGKIRAWVEFALKFFEACKLPSIQFQPITTTRVLRRTRRKRWYYTLSPQRRRENLRKTGRQRSLRAMATSLRMRLSRRKELMQTRRRRAGFRRLRLPFHD